MRGMYVRWAVYGLAMGFMIQGSTISLTSAGLAGGFVLGYVAGTPRIRGEAIWKTLAGICIAMTVVAFWIMYIFDAGEQLAVSRSAACRTRE